MFGFVVVSVLFTRFSCIVFLRGSFAVVKFGTCLKTGDLDKSTQTQTHLLTSVLVNFSYFVFLRGYFAVVKVGTCLKTGERVALKVFPLAQTGYPHLLPYFYTTYTFVCTHVCRKYTHCVSGQMLISIYIHICYYILLAPDISIWFHILLVYVWRTYRDYNCCTGDQQA